MNETHKDIDPSALTTQMVWREVGALKELVFKSLEEKDKAIALLQDIANRSPTINEVYIRQEEKFQGIQTQFAERDTRAENDKQAQTKAVDAAFQAQKEAAAKSEERTTKEIEKQSELLQTEVKGLLAQINELKDRFNRGEGRGEGADKNKTDYRLMLGVLIGLAGLIFGIIKSLQ
jgi:hypothetical protein